MRMRARMIAPLFVLCVPLALGCEAGDDEGLDENVSETVEEIQQTTGADTLAGGEADRPAERVTIRATSFAYEPSRVTVTPGEVRFVVDNAADIVHGFEVEGHGLEEEIAEIQPGATDSLTVTLEEPGEYRIYCPVADHESRGMVGTLIVEGGGS